jgi:hypothetical protein
VQRRREEEDERWGAEAKGTRKAKEGRGQLLFNFSAPSAQRELDNSPWKPLLTSTSPPTPELGVFSSSAAGKSQICSARFDQASASCRHVFSKPSLKEMKRRAGNKDGKRTDLEHIIAPSRQ